MWIVCNIDQHLWPSSATPGRNTSYYAAFYRYWYNFQVGHLLPHFRVPHVSPGPSCLVRRWDNVQNTCIVYVTVLFTNVLYICALFYNVLYSTLYCTLILYLFFPGQGPLPSLPQLTHRHMSLAEASSSASLMSSSLSLMASSSSLMTQSSSLMSQSSGGGVLNNLQSSPLWKNIETNFANECYSGEAEGKSKI